MSKHLLVGSRQAVSTRVGKTDIRQMLRAVNGRVYQKQIHNSLSENGQNYQGFPTYPVVTQDVTKYRADFYSRSTVERDSRSCAHTRQSRTL